LVVAEAVEVEAAGDDGDEDTDGTAGEDDERIMPPPPLVASEATGEEGVDDVFSVVVGFVVADSGGPYAVVGVGETVMAGVVEATEVVVCEAALEDAGVIAEPLPLEVEAGDDPVAPLWLRRHEGVFPEPEAGDDAVDGAEDAEDDGAVEDAAERVKLRGRVLDA
jgi:hypothetical protein